jgi:transposase
MSEIGFTQVVSRGCGIDVHKKTVVATINGEGLKPQTREFNTFTSSLTLLKDWLLSEGVTHVAMESTGVYWKPVYKILECEQLTVWIVNARHVKYVPGHKTDKKDSAWLCKLLLAGLLKPSYIPKKGQRVLRDLTRYRKKLIQQNASEQNRILRILEDCNIKLSSVLSNVSGVAGTKLIDKLCNGEVITMTDVQQVYHFKMQCSVSDLYEACQGFVDEHHIYLLKTIKRNIAHAEDEILGINKRVRELLVPFEHKVEMLREVPGIDRKTAEDLIAEIGLDMSVFPTEKHLASWVGICPGNNESAGKKKVDELLTEISKQKQLL